MPNSVTTEAVKSITRNFLSEALKAFGFVRRGTHFYRQSGDVFHCIHFQCSQWNSAAIGRFTVNLAVVSPSLYQYWTGRSCPANPATALWPIQHRLGLLSSKRRDIWWQMDSTTDLQKLAGEILSLLNEFGLPFFAQFPDSDAILANLRERKSLPGIFEAQIPLIEAMLLKDRNQNHEARSCIRSALQDTKVMGFRNTILVVAKRLGLESGFTEAEA